MEKTIMVTGATAGFGRAIAAKFAAGGYKVIITGRRNERLLELQKELSDSGAKVLTLNFDVRDLDSVKSAVNSLPSGWKDIDILVNNAGLAVGLSRINEGDTDDWDRMIDTNVKGLLYVTRTVAPLMVARGSGHVFNISSIAGKEVYENGNVYCASKHAVDALSKAMRIDMLSHDTEKADAVYRGVKSLTAEDIAEVIWFCASLPGHVCINDLTITPTQQAGTGHLNRKV